MNLSPSATEKWRRYLLSWQFAAFALVSLGSWLGVLVTDDVSARTAAIVTAAAAAASALGRGLANVNTDTTDWWLSPTVIVGLLGGVQAWLAENQDVFAGHSDYGKWIGSAVILVTMLARGIEQHPAVAAGDVPADLVAGTPPDADNRMVR